MQLRDPNIARLCWVLRVGVAMEFIGHGALGVFHLADAWTSYFAVVGIPRDTALTLMPYVGLFDMVMAAMVLFYPIRGVILYMTVWGLWTALLRPLAGESVWEAVERAGNFGALIALFLLATSGGAKAWIRFEPIETLDGKLRCQISWVLRLTTATLLLGHGALGLLVQKPVFATQYAMIGLHGAWVEPFVGGFECVLAFATLAWPTVELMIVVLVWKLATEALSPIAGAPFWVFIEHGGSYAAPFALALINRGSGHETEIARKGVKPLLS